MRIKFAGAHSHERRLPAFVGASLLANRGAGQSIASKLPPMVGGEARSTRISTNIPGHKRIGPYLLAFVGASVLATRGPRPGFARKQVGRELAVSRLCNMASPPVLEVLMSRLVLVEAGLLAKGVQLIGKPLNQKGASR